MFVSMIAASILLQIATGDPSRFNGFLVLAYGVMWLVIVVYLLNLANKQRNLRQDLELMRRLLEEDEDRPSS
jgi:CcmD family protein